MKCGLTSFLFKRVLITYSIKPFQGYVAYPESKGIGEESGNWQWKNYSTSRTTEIITAPDWLSHPVNLALVVCPAMPASCHYVMWNALRELFKANYTYCQLTTLKLLLFNPYHGFITLCSLGDMEKKLSSTMQYSLIGSYGISYMMHLAPDSWFGWISTKVWNYY